jgi:hypothetical protein
MDKKKIKEENEFLKGLKKALDDVKKGRVSKYKYE